jgi:hypothetical protein
MIQEDVRISTGALKDISALAIGQGREAVALGALQEAIQQGTLSTTQIAQFLELAKIAEQQQNLSSSTSPPIGLATKVNDHTFTYRLAGPSTAQTQESYIREKLGTDGDSLINELKYLGVDVSVKAPGVSEAILDTGSNNKTRTEQNLHYEGGLADPIQATNIAIEAICAAKRVGIDLRYINSESWEEKGSRIKAEALKADLDEGTATVLEKLTGGVIRVSGSGSGVLFVGDDGRLYARGCSDVSHSYFWAFGARPAPESKN